MKVHAKGHYRVRKANGLFFDTVPLKFPSIFCLDADVTKYYVEGLMKLAFAAKSVCAIAVVATLTLPVFSSAATAPAIQTRQLLPQGGNSCVPLTVTSIQEYVQDGDLNSFDVTINNPTYVAVFATIGGAPLSFQYMTRDIMPDGTLRIHVDVPIEMSHSAAIAMTLLSAERNITCMSTIAFGVVGVDGSTPVAAETYAQTPATPTPSYGTSNGTSGSGAKPGQGNGATTTVGTSTPVVAGTFEDTLNRACEATGSFQLWFVLLALFVVMVALVALSEATLTRRSEYLPGALIAVPLIILLGFWLFAEGCQATGWIPVILFVIAGVGLATVYRRKETTTKVIELPPANR